MSTSAEIGRRPAATNRLCSQGGLGVAHAADQAAGEVGTRRGGVGRELQANADRALEAARDRRGVERLQRAEAGRREIGAMPRTPRQSPRFGVTATSMIGSSRPIASAAGAPTAASSGSSTMPVVLRAASPARRAASRLSTPRIAAPSR